MAFADLFTTLRRNPKLAKGLHEILCTTHNWWSVLLFYLGVNSSTNVIFRNGARIFLNRETLAHYVSSRRLFFAGTKLTIESGGRWYLQLSNGLRFFIRPIGDHSGSLCEIFLDKCYEQHDLKGKVVIDVGAGIGDSSIYFASLGAEVYAFEPLLDSWEFARSNIKVNHLEHRVHLYNKAVASAPGYLALKTVKDRPCLTTTSHFQIAKDRYAEAGLAKTVTLDQIITQHGLDEVHLLKLDCEGCEHNILCNGNEGALAHVEKILMEYHGDPHDILRFLERIGFCTVSEETLSPRTLVGRKIIQTAVGKIYAENRERVGRAQELGAYSRKAIHPM